jgi:hypothetical protein
MPSAHLPVVVANRDVGRATAMTLLNRNGANQTLPFIKAH